MSEASSLETGMDTIMTFCQGRRESLVEEILFNDDLFDSINEDEDIYAYLFGVNNLGSKQRKLLGCTIMKFLKQEVVKTEELFEKEARDFTNNMRTPLGLIFKGESPQAIRPEHIKFLINIRSPFPVIMVLTNFVTCEGWLCSFDEGVMDRIKKSPNKQMNQLT